MPNEIKTCAFCGQILTGKTKSREQVWAKWLQKRLDIEKAPFYGVHSGDSWGIRAISTRIQSTSSVVLGGVCAKCNNGWMSELEEQVAPILEKFFENDNEKYIALDMQSCETLAQWAFKTSLVINLASNYRRIIPHKHFSDFYEHRKLPQNSAVDIALAPFGNQLQWKQGQSATGIIAGDIEVTERMSKLISMLYVITLDVAGVLLRTMWVPTDFLEIPRHNEHNVKRIYPFTSEVKLLASKRKSELEKFHISARFKSKKMVH